MEPDRIDGLVSQWAQSHPELDVSPLAITGRILTAARLLAQRHENVFRTFGLKRGEFDVLVSLVRRGPPHEETPTALSDSLLLSTSAMTNRLDRLEHDGLIVRSPDAEDRRGVRVGLTAGGHALVQRALAAHLEAEHELVGALSASERSALEGTLRSLLAALEQTPDAEASSEALS